MTESTKYDWSENYLLSQGYSENDINKYYNISKELVTNIKNNLFLEISKNKATERKAEIAFGQAGCGKSTYFNSPELNKYIILDIDNFREFHPYKNEIIEIIKNNHHNNKLPESNTPGRDFTNFTRKFIGMLFDELVDECLSLGYNIAFQKNITSSESMLPSLEKIYNHSYKTNLVLPLVNSKISWQRCQKRNEKNNLILNTVSKDFHDNYVTKIPSLTIQLIKDYIFDNNYIDSLLIINDNKIIEINKETNILLDNLEKDISNILE